MAGELLELRQALLEKTATEEDLRSQLAKAEGLRRLAISAQEAAEDAQQHALSIEGLCQAQGGEASGSGASATEAELRQQVADLATAMRQVRTEL